jgi:hypothetical protein
MGEKRGLFWRKNILQRGWAIADPVLWRGYGLDDWGSIPGRWWVFFHFATATRPALGPIHLPIQWVTGALSSAVKRPVRETEHSPPSGAEVKNSWNYTTTPPIRFHDVVLIKQWMWRCGTATTLLFTLPFYHSTPVELSFTKLRSSFNTFFKNYCHGNDILLKTMLSL